MADTTRKRETLLLRAVEAYVVELRNAVQSKHTAPCCESCYFKVISNGCVIDNVLVSFKTADSTAV